MNDYQRLLLFMDQNMSKSWLIIAAQQLFEDYFSIYVSSCLSNSILEVTNTGVHIYHGDHNQPLEAALTLFLILVPFTLIMNFFQ